MKTYGAYFDNEIRSHASSGGVFPCFAYYFLKNGGVVYGVTMSDDFSGAIYKRIDSLNEIRGLLGSKYLQAQINDSFRNVKTDLDNNIKVLFIGTACIINGLLLYIKKEYSNLFTVDIVCHGVPSAYLWEKYLDGKKLTNVCFRSKKYGWVNYGMLVDHKFTPRDENPFMRLYLSDLCLRPSCYNCIPKKNKSSDITIGDFWGVDEVIPGINDDKGTSLIIVRTEKGSFLFNIVKKELTYREINYKDAIKYNCSEYKSASLNPKRQSFMQDLLKCSMSQLEKKYLAPISLKEKIYKRIKYKYHFIKSYSKRK